MSTYKINVTAEDIAEAEQGAPQACMVWRAITRQLQLSQKYGVPSVEVSVGSGSSIVFTGDAGKVTAKVPQSRVVSNKIRRWDEAEDQTRIKPFDFDLNLPDDWREQITGGAK